jgi:hypothetical protein
MTLTTKGGRVLRGRAVDGWEGHRRLLFKRRLDVIEVSKLWNQQTHPKLRSDVERVLIRCVDALIEAEANAKLPRKGKRRWRR